MNIRFIGGMWRRIDGGTVRSFSTYQEAVENKTSWEDLQPKTTADDIQQQMKKQGRRPLTESGARLANRAQSSYLS